MKTSEDKQWRQLCFEQQDCSCTDICQFYIAPKDRGGRIGEQHPVFKPAIPKTMEEVELFCKAWAEAQKTYNLLPTIVIQGGQHPVKTVEQMIFEIRFPKEEYNPNDFNDWAKENEGEAYAICLSIAKRILSNPTAQP